MVVSNEYQKRDEMEKIVNLTNYRNSTPVITINGYPMKVEDIVEAAIIGGLNLLLVSERGEGKTQILYDVLYGVFGGNGTYIRTSPDMEIKDVYTALNLEQLREKIGSTEDIIRITEKARHPFTAIDELNRAPPIIQNQLLNVLDGYIEVKGDRYPLGIDIGNGKTYHIGIATVNLGDSRYLGTFGMDAAILDRFGIILNLDHYPPKTEDLIEIITQDHGLKVSKKIDNTSIIIEIIEKYRKVNTMHIPFEALIIGLYLREGIDYISVEPYSQRKTGGIIPEGVHEGGDIQGLMYPISIRSLNNYIQLYKACTLVAEMRGYERNEEYTNSLEILKLILPYSGSLKTNLVDSRYYGNPNLATEAIIEKIKEKIENNKDDIARAIIKKRNGDLSQEDLNKFNGEFEFIKKLLSSDKIKFDGGK